MPETRHPYDRPSDPAKRYSAALTDGPDRAAARGMLKAIGFSDEDLAKLGSILTRDGQRITLRVSERELPAVVSHLLGPAKTSDLAIEDPPLEDILRQMFKQHAPDGPNGKAKAP